MSTNDKFYANDHPLPTVCQVDNDAIKDHSSDIFFAVVENTPMPMMVTDPRQHDNPIVFANHAFIKMTGYASEEIVGKNCRFLQGPDTDRDAVSEIRRAVAERREITIELLNYRKDGSSFWNALFISPVYDTQKNVVYFIASQLDISRRKEAEDALGQAQKMEALGQLTGGIAHDFNNLLQVITGYLDILDIHADASTIDPQRISRGVENIRSAVHKAATLTQQLLAFARKQRLEVRTVNLNVLTENLADLVHRTLGGNITLHIDQAPALWNCRVDPTQMEVALLNILLNARDAMHQGGLLTLKTTNENLSADQVANLVGLEEGRYVSISITDTGVGMPPAILHRVMDPFFTTKEEGKGTGLGLSMVYGFAKQSGGAAQIDSNVGIGTTVKIYFPATDDAVLATPAAVERTIDRKGNETILVVDDRIEVAELAQAMLESFGYRVITLTRPSDALDLLNSAMPIDMLFSDVIMPGGMNGAMLAREARRKRPEIKILLTTGYSEASIANNAGQLEFNIINKPYRRTELSRKIRLVLDGPGDVEQDRS
ncbi:MAG: histidine kinase famiy protein [Pseudomonadota bacterium]